MRRLAIPSGTLYLGHMIYLGSDHAGRALKLDLIAHLQAKGLDFQDLGNHAEDPDDDYPDYAFAVAEAVAGAKGSRGILTCGSAQGVCIAANKVTGVRAAAVASPEEARMTREHNDANVLCLSGWKRTAAEAAAIVDAFLASDFSGEERHARRVAKISAYETDAR